MIYRLVRRDPAWKLMPYAAAGGALCTWARSGQFVAAFFGPLLYACLVFAGFRWRATMFQAALPISARDLFTARCVAFAALVWLPVLAAVGVAFVKGDATLGPVDCGAGASLLTISVLSVRLKEIEGPVSIMQPLQGLLGIFLCVVAFLFLPAAPVLAFCAITTVAFFARAWRAMPESFQVAPLEAQEPSKRRQAKSAPAMPRLLLLRSAVPLRGLAFLPLICQILFMHAASWPVVCSFGIFASGLVRSGGFRTNTYYWLAALPVARRKLLAIATAIATLTVAIPYTVSVAFGWGGHASFRLGLINVVCMMLVCMSELMLLMAWGSYRIRQLPVWVRRSLFIPVGVVVLWGYPAVVLIPWHGSRDHLRLVEGFILHLSQWLLESSAAILVLGVIAFAAMFRLLEKLDAQAEWPEFFAPAPARDCNPLKLN